MNKSDLIDSLATRMDGDKKTATAAVEGLIDVVSRAVSKGEKVQITGFGVFEKRNRSARTARNPRTGATIKVKKTSVPAFRPGQQFKDVVSGAKKLAKVATAPAAKAASAAKEAGTSTARTTKSAATSAPAKKTGAKSSPASTAVKSTTKKATTKAAATKAPAAKSATKATAAKSTAAKKTAATKSTAKKTAAKKASS